MKPKTKQEAQRLINELRSVIDELPDEGRSVDEGWWIAGGSVTRYEKSGIEAYEIAFVNAEGLAIAEYAGDALDGIAHDDKGRIKVVGYVNAEELKESLVDPKDPCAAISVGTVITLIDRLTG